MASFPSWVKPVISGFILLFQAALLVLGSQTTNKKSPD